MANPQSPIDPVQIKIASDLSKAITDINAAVESVNNGLIGVSKSLERISGLSKDVDTNSLTTMNDKLKNAGEEAQRFNKTDFSDISKQMNTASSATAELDIKQELLSKRAQRTGGFLKGLGKGITIMSSVSKAAIGVVSALAQGLFSFGFAILAIPFHLFNSFIEMANKAGPGSTELAQAIEKIRGEFGKLSGPGPKTVRNMATELKGFKDTGLSAYQIFGNTAERLNYFLELGKSLGPLFNNFKKELDAAGGAVAGYQKGLGLSNEEQRTVFETAKAGGTSVIKVYEEMRTQAQNLGDQFGMDSKHIAREVAKGMKDLKHFAGATIKEISTAVVYANKLGLELDKITGILDAFETFDTAAENASKLSQAFGVNIDAFKMMESQDPAGPIEALRKQFAAAGVDASTFNRQQMKLLTSSTHLDETTARMAFSLQNQGMSMDEIRKKADANQKKQLTQAEAMKKLADNIERLVKPFEAMQGGFFSRFGQGIMRGIQGSAPFIKILNNINRGLINATFAGVALGRQLVESFPGFKGMLEGIANFFDPKKYSRLFGGISKAIKMLRTGSAEEMAQFKSQIDKSFGDFFASNKATMSKIFDSFKLFAKTAFHIFAGALKFIIPEIVKFKDMVFNELKNPSESTKAVRSWVAGVVKDVSKFITTQIVPLATNVLRGMTNALTGGKAGKLPVASDFSNFIGDTFTPLWTALKDALVKLLPDIKEFLKKLIVKVIEIGEEVFSEAPWYAKIGLIFGNKFTSSMGSGLMNLGSNIAMRRSMNKLSNSMAEMAAKQATGSLAGGAQEKIAEETVKKAAPGILKRIGTTLTSNVVLKAPAAIAGAGPAAAGAGEAIGTTITGAVVEGAAAGTVGLGAAVGGVLIAGAAGFAAGHYMAKYFDNSLREERYQIGQTFDENNKAIAAELDVNKRLKEIEEQRKAAKAKLKEVEDRGFFMETWHALFGDPEEEKNIAYRELENLDRITRHTEKEIIKQQKEAQERMRKEKRQQFIGNVTLENAEEKFKQIEALSKKITSGGFKDLENTIAAAREKLNSTSFEIASPQKLKEIENALRGVADVRDFFASLFDIVSTLNKAKKEMSQITQADATNAFISSGNIMNFISSVMQVFGAGEAMPGQPPPGPPIQAPKVNVVKGVFDSVGEMFKTLGEVIKAITDAGKGFSTLPKEAELTKGISAINTSLNKFNTQLNVPETAKLKEADKRLNDIHTAIDNIAKAFNEISTIKFPGDIMVTASFESASYLMIQTKDTMQNLFNNLQNYFSGTFDANQISQFQSSILSAANAMSTALNTIETSGLGPAVMAISDIIGKINEVNNLLTNIPRVSVDPVKMKMLASGLGLGGTAKYEINTKPIIISVDVKVLLDSAQLERGLVLRQGSIIRDRLNYAVSDGTASDQANDSLPSNPAVEFANPAVSKGGTTR